MHLSNDKSNLLIKGGDLSEGKITSMLLYALQSCSANIQKSIDIANEAALQSERLNYKKGKADSYYHLGLFYMMMDDTIKCETYANDALVYYEQMDDQDGVANIMYVKGHALYREAKHHLSLEFLYKSLRLHRNLGNLIGEARTLRTMGAIFESFQEYDKAMETYLEGRRLCQIAKDKDEESNICNPLSGLYLRRGDTKEAIEAIETSIAYKQMTGDKMGLAYAYYGKGKILLYLKQYEEAESLFRNSLMRHTKISDKLGMSLCLIKLGSLELHRGNLDVSNDYLLEALELGKVISNNDIRYKAFFLLYQLEKNKGNVELALSYHEQFYADKSKVIRSGLKSRIKSLEAIWRMDALEEEAQMQREEMAITQKKNEELDRFVSRVSHDLKGPISSLLSLYNVVVSEVSDEKALKYFGMYHKRMIRLNQTVLDLLSLSRVNSLEAQMTSIDLNRMIQEAIDTYEHLAGFEDISFDVNIEIDRFYSDLRLVRIIVQNLIENSIKYRNDEGKKPIVSISVKNAAEDHIAIIVEDNGIGIPEKFQGRIYEMFYRATDKVSGSGLGMYITKNAVDKLEGQITMESRLGVGTKFVVLLPSQ